jgi:hypothetical protein
MSAPLLSALREPPIVGRYYMVPVVRHWFSERLLDWPVLGCLHHDREHIGFQPLHYHFDGRFLSYRQYEIVCEGSWHLPPLAGLNASVLHEANNPYWLGRFRPLPRRPELRRRRCNRAIQEWVVAEQAVKWGLAEAYGLPAEPIRRPDGRLLCPHRKADLSQFPPDADGIVTCPLHGLRVRCTRDTDRSGEAGQTAQQAGPKARAGAEGIAQPGPVL